MYAIHECNHYDKIIINLYNTIMQLLSSYNIKLTELLIIQIDLQTTINIMEGWRCLDFSKSQIDFPQLPMSLCKL